MGKTIALVILAALVVGAVKGAEYVPTAERAATDATWTPAEVLPVDVEAQTERVIEVSPVVITAKRAPRAVHQDAQCGAFQFRPLVQGAGNVRGFCGGGL